VTNFSDMLSKAKAMQEKMKEAQEQIKKIEVEGISGGSLVKVILTGDYEIKSILISDDLSMKSLKDDLKNNTIKTFSAGCNLALHCNGKLSEMKVVGDNSPKVSNFIIKKTSLFYKILS